MKTINLTDETFKSLASVLLTMKNKGNEKVSSIDIIAYILDRNKKLEAVAKAVKYGSKEDLEKAIMDLDT